MGTLEITVALTPRFESNWRFIMQALLCNISYRCSNRCRLSTRRANTRSRWCTANVPRKHNGGYCLRPHVDQGFLTTITLEVVAIALAE